MASVFQEVLSHLIDIACTDREDDISRPGNGTECVLQRILIRIEGGIRNLLGKRGRGYAQGILFSGCIDLHQQKHIRPL